MDPDAVWAGELGRPRDGCTKWGPHLARERGGFGFLADRTIGRAFGTMCRLSVCRLSVCLSVCDVLYCGETVCPSEKLSEEVNRKPGLKS